VSDPQNPIPPAPVPPVEHVSPTAPATIPSPATTAATASSAPAAPTATPAAPSLPKASASATLGKILTIVSSVLGGVVGTLPLGAVTAAVDLAEGGLRALAQWLTTKGADNQLTEAQAEAALAQLIAGLATIASPLPTPEEIEAAPATAPPVTTAP